MSRYAIVYASHIGTPEFHIDYRYTKPGALNRAQCLKGVEVVGVYEVAITPPPYPRCQHPDKCRGYCARDPNCGE